MNTKKGSPPRAKPRESAPELRKRAAAAQATPRAAATSDVVGATADAGAAFPIVGVGASAGGLEALEAFLRRVPPRCGMAFVVVQHLDPTRHDTALVGLLQHATRMPVAEVTDGVRVEPDHVYVTPPGKDMSLLHGVIHLLPTTSPRGLNLPIDFFFRSLAEDQQERAIGVILSGMGSDGTLGLRAIKEKAGAVFVQAIASAKFEGMPRSAIEAGLAEVVAPVEELPGRILAYREHAPHVRLPPAADEPEDDKKRGSLDKVFVLLRAQTGNDFSLYKRSTVSRRIERRMGLHQIDTLPHYVRYLRENRREIDLLFKELLIGVTSFFREPAAWDYLRSQVLPALLSSRAAGGVLRAWVPGCSTGEEAYSLAMVFHEAIEPLKPVKNVSLQIFATDLDGDAIEKARQAVYPDNIAADLSPEHLRRFFVQDDRGYRVSKEIREMVVFAQQNVIMDPPFTKLDVLSCRNLLIYLSADLQKKLIPLFHYSLNPGGVLFLGSAETVGAFTSLFAPLDGKTRLYKRLEHALVAVDFPSPIASVAPDAESEQDAARQSTPAPPNVQALADRVIVQRFAPVCVLCNGKGDIVYLSGRTGKYLEPAVGKANLNLFAMAREGLRYELSRAFATALRDERVVTARRVKVGSNGATYVVDVTVQRLVEPRELRGCVMVVLADAPSGPPERKPPPRRHRGADRPRIAELEDEVERAREEVQSTREEMQTSQEELKSTNEELQSTNEELQSTNEELTTSKEEMQSLNEELQTVNHELQAKVDELSRSNNDMKNLLNSTDIATLFLDGDLNIRRFTTPTARIIKLLPGDTGRPVTDITSDLEYDALADDAREVLRTLVFCEKQVKTKDGRWFVVRIMPYRTLDDVVDGLVLTFTDASASQALDATLRDRTSQFHQIADSLPVLVWAGGSDGSLDYVGKQWAQYTGVPEAAQLGFGWLEQVHPDDRARARAEWTNAASARRPLDLELRIRGASGAYRWFRSRVAPIRDARGDVVTWYGTSVDVDDLRRALEDERSSLDRLSAFLEVAQEAVLLLNRDLSVAFVSPSAEALLGRAQKAVLRRGVFDAYPELRETAFEPKLSEAVEHAESVAFELVLGKAGAYDVRIVARRDTGVVSVFLAPVAWRLGAAPRGAS